HDLIKYRQETGSILNYPGAETLGKNDRHRILEYDCDVLVPAALENQITMENVHNIQAKIIAEAANGPITSLAEAVLLQSGKLILPDVYLNAGGVTVAYFEWLKNLSHMRFGRMQKRFDQNQYTALIDMVERHTGRSVSQKERSIIAKGADEIDLVRSGLEETMITAYHQIREIIKRKPQVDDLRTASFVSAISKISNDYLSLGIFP
ncbi:MAG: Glu/Leu/Phe/Val dehydrogenase, partial [Saprospiraceae bacterium]|nr:Glu/Leu/Phe/Val dehydrogenase [Saprospiraceae bacterium]